MGRFKEWLLKEAKEEYARVILSLLEKDKEARLLDLGSGDGELTREMVSQIGTKDFYGIDMEPQSMEGIKVLQGDLNERFPVGSEEFHVVVASQIIEHLSETDNFLREIRRVLKPTGYAIISTPNLASWHNIGYLLLGRQPKTCMISDEMDWPVSSPAHRRLFTVDGLVRLLRFHRFEIEEIICSGYYPLPIGLARGICKIDKEHSVIKTVKVRRDNEV